MKFNIIILLLFLQFPLESSDKEKRFPKILKDDNSKFTSVGNIAITITNFGTYGHGFSLWPEQPSCEYPIGSGIEHLFDGGLWIGGFTKDTPEQRGGSGPFVSTGAVDASSVSARGGGFEFTNSAESVVLERSSLSDSKYFSPNAISHQDFLMEFTDTNLVYDNGEEIVEHNPLGVSVKQETYAWNFPFADFFVIFNFWIKNESGKYLDSVFVGLWTDTVVRNTNVTSPRTGSSFYNKSGNGFSDSLNIAYEFDATGDPGFTDSYIGIQYLGAEPISKDVNFVSWQFRNTDDPKFFAPQNDNQRYNKMNGYFADGVSWMNGVTADELKLPSNRSVLITTGAFRNIAPGDSINVVFAIVTAKKAGFDPASLDTEFQKENLYNNAGWALKAYNGEDRNGNGILDAGEESDGDGKITRYILPAPPNTPRVKVLPESNKVTIYWDNRAEDSVDPISGIKDFEGYRLYRTNTGFDLTESQNIEESLILMAEFDSTGNDIGYNTGFDEVKLEEELFFEGDSIGYDYKFTIENLLNGWQYIYAVSAFDRGDKENNLESLESSSLSTSKRVIPGTPSTEESTTEIGVYPNPYYGNAYWDGDSERLRKIYFFNLPENCEITIYTLAGDVVKRLYHSNQSNGNNIRWFETYSNGDEIMAGGEHAWDLITDSDQAIATGLYLFSVKNTLNNEIKTGKFLIIK